VGFRKGLLVPQLGISPISSVHITLDAQLAPEDAPRGEDDCEFRSVLPGHYSINRISLFGVPAPESIHAFVSNRALSVHFCRCIFPLRDGPNDSLLPSASPERLQSSPAPSVFRTPPRPGGVFVRFPTTRAGVTTWEPAAARSCPAWLRRAAASDGSLPAVASSSGHVSPADRPSSPASAPSWSMTSCRPSWAAPAAAAGCLGYVFIAFRPA